MLRFLSAGESHGQALTVILDGFPCGLSLRMDGLENELKQRQQGYGRSNRQKIETDTAEITGGVRHGITTGAPIALSITNKDFVNWQHVMSSLPIDRDNPEVQAELEKKSIKTFRPGHADLAGTLKFKQKDVRNVLERASARETAARVAAGAICQQLLETLDITLFAHVVACGPVQSTSQTDAFPLTELEKRANASAMRCLDPQVTEQMQEAVKSAWQKGDSLGGTVEVLVDGLPIGLGSYSQWDEKLDGKLAQALMSIQAIKAVEIGDGILAAGLPGSQVHDALYPAGDQEQLPFTRKTNHAGGMEGGMTNGSRLKLRAYMKPLSTLNKGLPSLSFPDFKEDTAHYERSDVCAVPSAAVVAKAMVAFVLAREILQKFGGDNLSDIQTSLMAHKQFCSAPELK
ncbi:MAG: chorismate synthase [Candidatus Obscuribacterales bacterium]|nr:chorismate synthase [Candidatus Obscuribacterales bacterium]